MSVFFLGSVWTLVRLMGVGRTSAVLDFCRDPDPALSFQPHTATLQTSSELLIPEALESSWSKLCFLGLLLFRLEFSFLMTPKPPLIHLLSSFQNLVHSFLLLFYIFLWGPRISIPCCQSFLGKSHFCSPQTLGVRVSEGSHVF